jgi:propionyl-CoA carboxylase alpha chain/3-methylcrotonyl-CoA carboxylase alpha subunit
LAAARVTVDGELVEFELVNQKQAANLTILKQDGSVVAFENGDACEVALPSASSGAAAGASDGAILSPMPGKVVSVSTRIGDSVTRGQTLLVLEAMKMEHAMTAPFDGVVAELTAVAGGQVSEGIVLVRLEPA